MNSYPRIVVVEDNPADIELTFLAFRNLTARATVIALRHGLDLINFLKNDQGDPVSLILLDLNMPEMSGREVLPILKQHPEWSQIPVVIFTSSTHQEDINSCYALGANAFVTKPLDIVEYDRAIAGIVNFWSKQPPQAATAH